MAVADSEKMGYASSQKTPQVSLKELTDIIDETKGKLRFHFRPFDEVFPGICIGGAAMAMDEEKLQSIGITHVLNAAQGTKTYSHVNTNAEFYKTGIVFHGIPATDLFMFKISKYFKEATSFIASAVGTKSGPKDGNKIYVHCREGVSRSATFVLAYLVTHQDMGITEALKTIRNLRAVNPNPGFLQQLVDYSAKLGKCY